MYGYIYLTENLINGKCYIGKHYGSVFDNNYKGSGTLLWNAIEKYGWDNFVCEPIEWCNSLEELNNAEKKWIEKTNAVEAENFYNLAYGGDGGWEYVNNNGLNVPINFHPNHKGNKNPFYCRKHTEEAKQKMRKPKTEEHKRKLSEANKGKRFTEEHKDAISKGQLGHHRKHSSGYKQERRTLKHWRLVNGQRVYY